MADKKWRQFEIAVANFIQAIGGNVTVKSDVKLPDAHTGLPRQRDVIIETNAANHFPIRILVSCKDYKRPLTQEHVDHFHGEFLSSHSQVGVIYSRSGFNSRALKKAKKLGFSCCQLFENQPPSIPSRLIFSSYCVGHRLFLGTSYNSQCEGKTWKDLFEIKVQPDSQPLINTLAESLDKIESATREAFMVNRVLPERKFVEFELSVPGTDIQPLRVRVGFEWVFFRGKIENCLINGSYNFTNDQFIGSQLGPMVDLKSYHPGPGWEELNSPPKIDADTRFNLMWRSSRAIDWLNSESQRPLAKSSSQPRE